MAITPNALDSSLSGFFNITAISGGSLFQNDGVTPIASGAFITFAQGAAGLRFTPAASSTANGSFTAQASTTAANNGLGGGAVVATIAVGPVPQAFGPGAQTTPEDVPLVFSPANGNGITLADAGSPSGNVQVGLNATSGTLSLASAAGLTFTVGAATGSATLGFSGTFTAVNAALNGLSFIPSPQFTGSVGIGLSATEAGNSATFGVPVTVVVATHMPSVARATTNENQPTHLGLVITPSPFDQALAGFFKISAISGGALFQSDGVTPINAGDFITFAQGSAGLQFSPTANSTAGGRFYVQASTSNDDGGLGGSVVQASITVNPVPQVTIPGTQITPEDATMVYSSAAGNAITVADPGNVNGPVDITLAATDGTLTLATRAGLTLTSGTGTGDTAMAFSGTFAAVNAALNGLSFAPSLHFFGSASFSITASEGSNMASASASLTVNRVAHTPTVTRSATNENQPTAGGLAIAPDALDASTFVFFKITGISGGTLWDNDGDADDVTPIQNGDFIALDQAAAGLKFVPTPNSTASGRFTVQASLSTSDNGLGGSTVPVTIAVNPVPQVSASPSAATPEDTPLVFSSAAGNPIVVADPGNPAGPVRITLSAASGTLTLATRSGLTFTTGTGSGDSSVIFSGTFAAVNAALDGLSFTPALHFSGSGGLSIGAAEGGNVASANIAITVSRTAHTPTVSGAATNENQQTSAGLVITPNSLDASLGGFFKITAITGGTLFQHDGVTPIQEGDFITFSEGAAGLRFMPATNSASPGSFSARASTSGADAGLGGAVVAAAISVNAPPVVTVASTPLAYTENQGLLKIDPALTATDADNVASAGATVRLIGFVPGQDVLGFTNQNGITGSWDSVAGILTLSGPATVGNYQAALRSVTFRNLSGNPDVSPRIAEFTVSDGALRSAPADRAIAITAVNNPPVISGPPFVSVKQDTTLTLSSSDGNAISVSDIDANGAVEQLTLSARARHAHAQHNGRARGAVRRGPAELQHHPDGDDRGPERCP